MCGVALYRISLPFLSSDICAEDIFGPLAVVGLVCACTARWKKSAVSCQCTYACLRVCMHVCVCVIW